MATDRYRLTFGSWMGALGALAFTCDLTVLGAPASAEEGLHIGVVFPIQHQARWAWEERILLERAKANGDEVIVQYSNESAATQKNQVESMIERGVDVLIVTPIDAQAAGDMVNQAQAEGIKVITYDRGVAGAIPDFAIERNNYDAGRLHAEEGLRQVPSGEYAIIRGDESTLAAVDMGRAYDELLHGQEGIDIVYDTLTPSWDTAAAQREAEAALQRAPEIDAFVVMWDNGAQAVVQALKSAGMEPGDVYVSGTDASPVSLGFIDQGWQSQTVWTPIDQMATNAADIAHALGKGVEPTVASVEVNGIRTNYVDLVSVTKDNLCEFVTEIAPKGWVLIDEAFGVGNNPCG